jgi:outer membrane immunogenic protein
MKKILLTGAAVLALQSVSAHAADMAAKAPPMLAPVAAFDWSGFYIGGDVGWQGSRIGLSSPGNGPLTYEAFHQSVAAGGFLGAQRQFGQFVLGVEGGYWSAFNQTSLGATPAVSIFSTGGTGTAQAKLRNVWSVGARVGWAIGYWMPYLTSGYANGSFEFDAQDVAPSTPGSEQVRTNADAGYIGGGIDWAATNNIIVGVEYRHYGFNAKTPTATATFSGAPGFTEPVSFAPSTETVVARLSYKFDWSLFH